MNNNTANKSVIRWKAVPHENPSNRSETIYVPTITERNDTKTLTEVVYSAIDRGLIAGLKTSAAQAIAEGILVQLGQELNAAHGVVFGDFFAVRAYLTGTDEGLLAPLTAENKLSTKFVAGTALKLDRKDFSFRNVLETGDTPFVDEVQAAKDGAESGAVVAHEPVQFIGTSLKMGENDKIRYWSVNPDGSETEETPVTVDGLSQNSNNVVTVKADEIDIHAPGERYAFMFEKTVEIDGKTATVQSNKVYATSV